MKNVCDWAHKHGILWYHSLSYPEPTSLIEYQNVLLNVQLKLKLRSNTLKGWNAILQDAVYALNLRPSCSTMSPIGRIHGSGNQGMEARLAPLSIFPSNLFRGGPSSSELCRSRGSCP